MKRLKISFLSIIALCIGFACSDMNDLHDKYLRDGEDIYIGKVDSVRLFPGNERLLVQYFITDPRAKELEVFWSSRAEKMTLDIPAHQPEDVLEFMIDPITEGDHEFVFLTNDKEGNSSVRFEALQAVYGPLYQATLTNRPVQETTVTDKTLSVLWGGSLSTEEVGVNVTYVTTAGQTKLVQLETGALKNAIVFEDVDLVKSVQYQTLYMPSAVAIDTFATDMGRMTIRQRVNVALNKPVKTSNNLNDTYTGVKAVDGILNDNASRWVTDDSNREHWIEVDLGQPYEVDGFKTYTGASGNFNYPTANFDFQVEVDGEWQTIISVTGNSNAQYETNFGSVMTSKIRYLIPAYSPNQVRLYELEVYATIEY